MLDESRMRILGNCGTLLASGDKIIESNQIHWLVENLLVKAGKHLHEIAAKKTTSACKQYRLTSKILSRAFYALDDLMYISIKKKLRHD